jgi:hypothetical protein
MKKLLGILVLGLLWCNVGFADVTSPPPQFDEKSLNKNILKHGWKVKSMTDGGLLATEIYTLTKDKWMLICTVRMHLEIKTVCKLP